MSGALPGPEDGMEVSLRRTQELLPQIENGSITLVDCREEDERRFNRLPGARWIPLSGFGEASLPEGPVIVYCHHGMRSLRAASYFRSRGNAEAWSMAGGIDAWSLEIDPEVPRY